MKSYIDIANKYFMKNKKRSMLNIIAIIVATMFISGTGHIIYSSQQNIINMLRADGDYHVKFELDEKEKYKNIKEHVVVDKSTFRQKVGNVKIGEKTLVINEINSDKFSLLGVRVEEGRFPEKSNEIILNADFKESDNKKIGDKITVKLFDGKSMEYTVVGFSQCINRPFLEIFDAYTINSNIVMDNVEVYLKLKEVGKLNNKIYKLVEDFNIKSDKVFKNEPLLNAIGEGRSKSAIIDYITFFMVGIVVMIATLIFIYNSFNIATMERMKEYGLIKAIGGTNKQIRRIIIKETFIIGLIALPMGLILGVIASSEVFKTFNNVIFNNTITVKTYFSLESILVSILITFITLYLSVISVLGKVKKISPLDCFTNRNCEIKKLNKRKMNLSSKIFSIEGIIANRNIRTNKGRFKATVISIVISITIFITFSSLVCNIDKLPYEALPMDKNMARYNHYFTNIYDDKNSMKTIKRNSEEIKLLVDNAKKIDGVKNVYKIYEGIKSYTFMPKNKVMVKGDTISINGSQYTNLKSEIVPIDLESIDDISPYLLNNFNNKEKMKKGKGVYITQVSYEQDMKNLGDIKYNKKDITKLKVGDEILIDTSNLMSTNKFECNNSTVKEVMKVKVLGIVRVNLFDKESIEDTYPTIYMTTELYNDLIEKKRINSFKDNEKDFNKKLELDRLQSAEVKGMIISYKENLGNKKRGDIGKTLMDNWNKYTENEKISTMDSENFSSNTIFTDGDDKYIKFGKLFYFSVIAFITIISMANVFNVVNTNVTLRSKELELLSIVGASRNSINKIMYLEGSLYSVIGIIYGTIIGGINSILINSMFRSAHDIAYVYPYKETLISIVFFLVVGILAIYIPLKRVKKENLLKHEEK